MNVTGLTVHIGARVGAAADPGQVLVSRTVHDLVAGSGLTFASRGEHELKGVPGSWELFAVTHAGDQPEDIPHQKSMQTPMDKLALQTARKAPGLMRAAVRLGNAIERRRSPSGLGPLSSHYRSRWLQQEPAGLAESMVRPATVSK